MKGEKTTEKIFFAMYIILPSIYRNGILIIYSTNVDQSFLYPSYNISYEKGYTSMKNTKKGPHRGQKSAFVENNIKT